LRNIGSSGIVGEKLQIGKKNLIAAIQIAAFRFIAVAMDYTEPHQSIVCAVVVYILTHPELLLIDPQRLSSLIFLTSTKLFKMLRSIFIEQRKNI
jgi:hypothetical protein